MTENRLIRALEMKIPPLLLGIAIGYLMWLCTRALPRLDIALSNNWLWGSLFAFIGLALAFRGVSLFRQSQTTANPLSGKRVSKLVTTGVYRYSRNPMYLGMLLILFGWFLVLANWAALPFLPVFVKVLTELQIKPEERLLREKFGQEYVDFLGSTARWFGF